MIRTWSSCCLEPVCRTRFHLKHLAILCLVSTLMVYLAFYGFDIFTTVSYATRPIWDKPGPSENLITLPHYYSEGVDVASLCVTHGWQRRNTSDKLPRVVDAFIFSVELDLLEIRIYELFDVVDTFVIVEGNKTFTGIDKPLSFRDNRDRFKFAEHKIVYADSSSVLLDEAVLKSPWENESLQRQFINGILAEQMNSGDLIIMSDVDEMPSGHTIDLLRKCQGWPDPIHLQMRNYQYSFEYLYDLKGSKAAIQTYAEKQTFYGHGIRSSYALVDSGWHCTFCFPRLSDFVFKMKAYSHTDRVRHPHFLDRDRIQAKICAGENLFDMLPEAYTFRDLIVLSGAEPYSGMVGMPRHLIENAERFKYLLPGGCQRIDGKDP